MDKVERELKELRKTHNKLENLLIGVQAQIRHLNAHPPETIKRVVVKHKPMPKPVRGDALWLDPNGAPIWRCGTSLLLPETIINFTPRDLKITPDHYHSQFGLRIRWEW